MKRFFFSFHSSKLKDSEKKNLELLSEIEQLIKDTEELRSEKGMKITLHTLECTVPYEYILLHKNQEYVYNCVIHTYTFRWNSL